MQNENEFEEIRNLITQSTVRLEFRHYDDRGLRLSEPYVGLKVMDDHGWETPWIDADVVALVVKEFREKYG